MRIRSSPAVFDISLRSWPRRSGHHRQILHVRIHHAVTRWVASDVAGFTAASRRTAGSRRRPASGLPQKAFNIRRNPKVSMLFSEPTGSGVAEPGAVLIQGDATAEDRIVTDVSSDPDLEALAETMAWRQPAGAFWSSWLGKRMCLVVLHAHPDLCDAATCAASGQPAISSAAPEELDLSEVRRVD